MGIIQNFRESDNKGKMKYLLFLLLLLIFIGLVIYFITLLFKKEVPVLDPTQPSPVYTQEQIQQQRELTINPIAIGEQRAIEVQQGDVATLVGPFVERFGSYNNQDGFQNFGEIEVFMTSSLASWVNSQYKNQLQEELPSIDTYYSINTKVLSTTVENMDDVLGEAKVRVTAQRQEVTVGGSAGEVFYQDAVVDLVLENSVWKIDGVYWL